MQKSPPQSAESSGLKADLRNGGIAANFLMLIIFTAGYFAFNNEPTWQRSIVLPILFVAVTPLFSIFMRSLAWYAFRDLFAILDDPAKRPQSRDQEMAVAKRLVYAPWLVTLGTVIIWIVYAPASYYLAERITPGIQHSFLDMMLSIMSCLPVVALAQMLRVELVAKPYVTKARIGRVADLAQLPLAMTVRKRLFFALGLLGPYSLTLFAVLTYKQLSSCATVNEALQKFFSLQLFFIGATTFCSILLALYLLKVVNQPLEQIRQALTKKSQDDAIIPHTFDEFGVVANLVVERNALEAAKQEFFAVVSHELRSPLMSIKAFLGLLAEGAYGDLPERVQKKSILAEQNAGRLVGLINNILDAEKLQSGKFECLFAPSSTIAIVEKAVRAVSDLAERENVEVVTDCPDEKLICDEERMVQVMVNFLSNAIKNAGGRPVTAKAVASGETIEFGVSDEGAGLAVDMQEQVFEKFKQFANDDGHVKAHGTGIGLPIAKALVEQHGGVIGVKSEQGKGSYFWARIPRQQKDDLLSTLQNTRQK